MNLAMVCMSCLIDFFHCSFVFVLCSFSSLMLHMFNISGSLCLTSLLSWVFCSLSTIVSVSKKASVLLLCRLTILFFFVEIFIIVWYPIHEWSHFIASKLVYFLSSLCVKCVSIRIYIDVHPLHQQS